MTWYFLGTAGVLLALLALSGWGFFAGAAAAGLLYASYKLWENEESPRR